MGKGWLLQTLICEINVNIITHHFENHRLASWKNTPDSFCSKKSNALCLTWWKGLKTTVLRARIVSWKWLWKNGACLLYQIHVHAAPTCPGRHIAPTHARSYLAKPCRAHASVETWTGSNPASYIIRTTVGCVFTEELLFLRLRREREENCRIPHTNSTFMGMCLRTQTPSGVKCKQEFFPHQREMI